MNLHKVKISDILDKLIFINIIAIYCFDGMPFIGRISKIFLIVMILWGLLYILLTKKLRFNLVFFLTVLFSIYCYCLKEYQQGEWSAMLGMNFQTAITVTLATLTFIVIFCYADTEIKREKIIKYVTLAGIWLAVETLLLVRTNIFYGLHASGMTEYLGRYGLQSNQMGVCWGFSFLTALYLYKQYDKKKYLYYMLINLLFLVLSGSRKALIYLVIGAFIFFVLSGYKDKLGRILLGVMLIFIAYIAIMYIPVLYQLIGKRISSLIDVLNGGIGTDTTSTRYRMIQYGIMLIKQNPIYGHGLNAFSHAYGSIYGNYVYAHNNFIELMVSGGLVLTGIYYSKFIIIIKKLYATLRTNSESVLFIAMIGAILIADIAAVTYYYRIYYVIFAVAAASAYGKRR